MRRLFVLLLLTSSFSYADIGPISSIAFWPGVSLGYSIGGGISCGFDFGATVLNYNLANQKGALGADISFDLFHGKSFIAKKGTGWYRLYCVNLLNTFNDNLILKVGKGKTWTRWGKDNVNKSQHVQWGLNLDISYAPRNNELFFGFHHCKVNTHCIGLAMKSTNIVYASYKYPVHLSDNSVRFGK
jgi:hypothetical protein